MSGSTRDEYIRKYGYEAVAAANGELSTQMTKREAYAMAALQGILANPDISGAACKNGIGPIEFRKITSEAAFHQADAMLKASKSDVPEAEE